MKNCKIIVVEMFVKKEQPAYKILKIENPCMCRIVERINRFVVKVEVGGDYYRAHLNNTGRLSEFLIKGRKAFCVRKGSLRRTDVRLFAIQERNLGALIDTQLQMKAYEISSERNLIPWLEECSILRRNARLGTSLIDYLLECKGDKAFLEAKSAVLRDRDYAMYPDCPSLRGQKHIGELTDYVEKGGKGILLFMAALPYVTAFKPNRKADPILYRLLKKAKKAGLHVKSMGLYYNPEDLYVYLFNPDLKVELDL